MNCKDVVFFKEYVFGLVEIYFFSIEFFCNFCVLWCFSIGVYLYVVVVVGLVYEYVEVFG